MTHCENNEVTDINGDIKLLFNKKSDTYILKLTDTFLQKAIF